MFVTFDLEEQGYILFLWMIVEVHVSINSLQPTVVETLFLAHLWGFYAIPVALSVVRRLASVVRRVSSVSTITTRNN